MKKVTDLTENEVIQCNTEAEAIAICKLMHEAGLVWSHGGSYMDRTNWEVYNEPIYYKPVEGFFGKVSMLSLHNPQGDPDYKVYQASDFLPELDKPIDKVTTDLLHQALVVCGISMPESFVDRIIDVVELLEEKGAKVTLEDLNELKKSW